MRSQRFRELAGGSEEELEEAMRAGRAPALESLLGYEYCGWNHARFAALVAGRKFVKGFFSAGGAAFGYNVRARQNGLEGDWLGKPDDAAPRRLGFFSVVPVEPGSRDDKYPNGLLLDYGSGGNRALDPARLVRDYLVALDATGDVLLGKAYTAFGRARRPVGFFLLERRRAFEVDAELERRVLRR